MVSKIINGVLVGFFFIYICVSVLVMNHLVQENNQFCAQRTEARDAIRTSFERRGDWTPEEQVYLDKHLPAFVNC